MKKYLKLLPIVMFPYSYMLGMAIIMGIMNITQMECDMGIVMTIIGIIYFIYLIWVITMVVYLTSSIVAGRYSAKEAVKMNLFIKCAQIPAYIFHFLLGMLGMLMSIWGIGVIVFAVLIDVSTIILTGTVAIGSAVNLKRENYIDTGMSWLMAIGSYIFCIDVVIAVIYYVIIKKNATSLL